VLGTTIWASEANTIWAVYWLIAAPLTQPEGLGPLIAEIDASRSKYLEEHPGTEIDLLNDPDATYDWISSASANLPLLTAMIQEVLRLYSSVLSKRRVTRPTTLGGHPLEKDQDVLVVIRAVHMDEEIHEDATSWRPERYLKDADNANGGGSAKKYMKDGKSVPNHSMPWGGGVSMCEGRYVPLLFHSSLHTDG
jgi:cytochrome P450